MTDQTSETTPDGLDVAAVRERHRMLPARDGTADIEVLLAALDKERDRYAERENRWHWSLIAEQNANNRAGKMQARAEAAEARAAAAESARDAAEGVVERVRTEVDVFKERAEAFDGTPVGDTYAAAARRISAALSGESDLRARLTALADRLDNGRRAADIAFESGRRSDDFVAGQRQVFGFVVGEIRTLLATPDHLDCTHLDCTETVAPTAARCGEGHPQARRGAEAHTSADYPTEHLAGTLPDHCSLCVPAEPARESDGVGGRVEWGVKHPQGIKACRSESEARETVAEFQRRAGRAGWANSTIVRRVVSEWEPVQ